MGQPAAKKGDKVSTADLMDTHFVKLPNGALVRGQFKFVGTLNNGLSRNVTIMGEPAATVESTADIDPGSVHVAPPPGTFVKTPKHKARISEGSRTVKINGKAAARDGDAAFTCNDPDDLPNGKVVAKGTVFIG